MASGKFPLDGRVAVVTGPGQGTGPEIARAIATAGVTTVIAEINTQTGTAGVPSGPADPLLHGV